jgi:integrase
MPRIPSYACELPDGRRIRFSLKKRPDSPYYFVCFRDAEGRRRELTTGEKAKHAAGDAALPIIKDAYTDRKTREPVSWDDALKRMKEHMEADNLRPGSIQQYELAVAVLRKVYPESDGPADVTPAMAEGFKVKRMAAKLSPRTVEGNIGNLSIVFGHWFRDTLKIIDDDPFASVEPPKYDKARPRLIEAEEEKAFLDWLRAKWDFPVPVLFLKTKAAIGCRIGELARARSEGLKDGRIRFTSETTKGRKERACRLPPALYTELEALAGPEYVFEAFSEGLREIHLKKGDPHHAKAVKGFTPERLVNWLQEQAQDYFDKSEAKKFKLHNFRGTAMSKARMAGVDEADAAIAFGCNPVTMRQHYLALDEARIADDVFAKMQSG